MDKEKKITEHGTRQRQLKVYYKHFDRAYSQSVTFPEIRLCGKWVKEAGFDCGEEIIISHEKGKIIITGVHEKEEE